MDFARFGMDSALSGRTVTLDAEQKYQRLSEMAAYLDSIANPASRTPALEFDFDAQETVISKLERAICEEEIVRNLNGNTEKFSRACITAGIAYAELAQALDQLKLDNTRSLLCSYLRFDPPFRQAFSASASAAETIRNAAEDATGPTINMIASAKARKVVPLDHGSFNAFYSVLDNLLLHSTAGGWSAFNTTADIQALRIPEPSRKFYSDEIKYLRLERIAESRVYATRVAENPDDYPYVHARKR